MKQGAARLTTVAAATVLALTVAPIAAAAAAEDDSGTGRIVIDDGHVDMGPRIIDGVWRVQIRDDHAEPVVWRHLEDVVLVAPPAAELPVPDDPVFEFLGEPGTPVYLLPQTQQPGLVWPGWNTQHESVNTAIDGTVTWSLDSVDAPGDVVLFLSGSFGSAETLFDSRDPLPQTLELEPNIHVHGNWVFTQPGVYRVGVTMSATLTDGSQVSDSGELQLAVGDVDPQSAFGAEASGAPGTPEEPVASATETLPASETASEPAQTQASSTVAASGPSTTPEATTVASAAVSTPPDTGTASAGSTEPDEASPAADTGSGISWGLIAAGIAVALVAAVMVTVVVRRRARASR